MTGESVNLIISGGATTVLLWLVWQFLAGSIYSKAAHEAIIGPFREANANLRQELKEQTSTAALAVIAQQESTRLQIAELMKTNAELVTALTSKDQP